MNAPPRPTSTDDVRAIVAAAFEARTPLEIRGNGTKTGVGGKVRAVQLLELHALSGVLDYEMAELVLTARAGTPLVEIETLLASHGQMLAFEPADYGPLLAQPSRRATLGGILAGNIAGPRKLQHGAARDHFLGFSAVAGGGEVFKAGGKVVKNVTGYDMPKLLAGSWGTLAVLTEVTVKVLPRPETVVTVAISGLDARTAAQAMSVAAGSPLEISAAAHLPAWAAAKCGVAGAVSSLTLLRVDGVAPSVAARSQWLRDALQKFGPADCIAADPSLALWEYIRDVRPLLGGDEIVWRIQVPPMNGWQVVAALSAQLEVRAFYDWAGGLVWLCTGHEAHARAVHAAARQAGGHAMLIRAPDHVREDPASFAQLPPALDTLTRRVKASLDPAGIFNPGRLFA